MQAVRDFLSMRAPLRSDPCPGSPARGASPTDRPVLRGGRRCRRRPRPVCNVYPNAKRQNARRPLPTKGNHLLAVCVEGLDQLRHRRVPDREPNELRRKAKTRQNRQKVNVLRDHRQTFGPRVVPHPLIGPFFRPEFQQGLRVRKCRIQMFQGSPRQLVIEQQPQADWLTDESPCRDAHNNAARMSSGSSVGKSSRIFSWLIP